MISPLQSYVDAILSGRDWSWTVVGILYVLAAYFVRGWFVNPLSQKAKNLSRESWHRIKSHYLSASFLGWVFFFFPLAIVVLIWRKTELPVPVENRSMIVAGCVSFVLSVMLHLQAFALAAVAALKDFEEKKDKAPEI